MLNPRLALLGEVWVLLQSADQYAYETYAQTMLMVAAQYWLNRRLWIKGGIGASGLSITYDIASRTTLPSRADRQFLQIAAAPMQADVYRKAIPVLTSSIFQEASVVNTGNLVLLEGPISSYRDGRFVGHGDLPTVAVGEPFTVGFGIDASLRTTREIVSRERLGGVFCEMPSNPLLRCADIREVAAILEGTDTPLVIDDTVASSINIDLGDYADAITTSLTKYFSGVGDVMGGVVIRVPLG